MKTSHFSLIAAAVFSLAGAAQAANTISIRQNGFVGSSVNVDIEQRGINDNTSAGLLNFDIKNGASFGAYCVELGQFTSTNYTTYTVGSFSGTQASNLQHLFSANYASVDTNTERAAFQLAVWELTHEKLSGPASVTELNGDAQYFNLNNSTTNYTTLKDLANSYLTAGAAYQGSSLYQIEKLSNDYQQDLLRFNAVTAVPEPSSYALLLAGLGAIGFMNKRRARSA
ncbi:PEP-CTERM sorting domain-containing protein [Paucibacter sp. Y2R2-4]|uniref:PEP-CTERM sorting domain-containing protein n=1 Tax=Paucibacter sp. Y2R2-4 TaxID=2893553 RepID=UPI0021E38767|nr:PEP-CTERM sorting domain-containing protein [Paucibacter sp. Y2R2-4]MCV2349277.1 PEP-CTERM sorting domain-containing protein [Paucibacter sp. Y2R2-4]